MRCYAHAASSLPAFFMSLASRIALRTGFVLIVVLAAGAALATAGFFVAKKIYEGDLPSVEAVQELPLQVPLRIYTRDGKLIGEFGAERRDPLDYAELPKPLIEAFIAAEDARSSSIRASTGRESCAPASI